MNLVTLEKVSKQYSERLLLDNVDLLINQGDRIGLIGVNGSGKTTLLHIIAGLEPPDSGSVTVWGGVRSQYLPQEPRLSDDLTVLEQLYESDARQLQLLRTYRQATRQLQADPHNPELQRQLAALTEEMERTGAWAADVEAKTILTRVGVTDFAAPVSTLSGGQRKRVALARALLDRADLLILDEPTNHIDADAVAWLEEYLVNVPGALLMVTHDRYFLDRVVNRIVELDRRQLIAYSGNYTNYLELRTARQERLAAAEEKRQNLLRRELEWLRRGPKARGTKQKARKQRIAELDRIRYDRGEDTVAMALASRRLGKKVLHASGLSKSYDGVPVFANAEFSLSPGDRIGLVGPNGIGKSTLLDILAGRVEPDTGALEWGETVQLAYYDQLSRELDSDMRVLEFINSTAPVVRTKEGERVEAAQMLEWFLFPRPQQYARISSLSGGERRRLYLLYVLAHQPNVLLLDEPTNDLDIQTLNVLEEFLDHFRGCLVVASHDRYFLDRAVDFLVTFEGGALTARYPTPYSVYQRLRDEARQQQVQMPETTPRKSIRNGRGPAQPRRLSWKEERELESLEDHMEELEVHKQVLQEEINARGSDFIQLQSLTNQLQVVEAELEQVVERWLELSEIREAAEAKNQ